MANDKWVLSRTMINLRGDVEMCESMCPSYDMLGTLKVNLEVCEGKKAFASQEQLAEITELGDRARKVLSRWET